MCLQQQAYSTDWFEGFHGVENEDCGLCVVTPYSLVRYFNPEDKVDTSFENVGNSLQDYMVS